MALRSGRSWQALAVMLATVTFLLAGCAGTVKNMAEAPIDKAAVVQPDPGKALLVFARPSGLGWGVQSSVFEIKDGQQPALVGIVAAKAKLAYQAEPGQHLFMVVGESSDYMQAELLAGQTYHAQVVPRMGVWKARFSLAPVSAATLDTPQFKSETAECTWVQKTVESDAWARENMDSVLAKHAEYWVKWQAKPPTERPRLLPSDGR